MTHKSTAYFLSVKGNHMSNMLQEYVFDLHFLKKSKFLDGLKSLQLNIKGCCMLCLIKKQPVLLER